MSNRGTVAKWLPKGFGFIKPDDGGDDVFCHKTALDGRDHLLIGENVEYDMTTDDRSGKMRAENVTGDGTGEEPDMEPREERRDDRRGGGDYGGGRDRGYGGGRSGGYGGGREERRGGDRGYGGGDRDRGYGGGRDRHSGGGRDGGRDGGRKPGICYQYRDGNCRYGDRCRFSHEG